MGYIVGCVIVGMLMILSIIINVLNIKSRGKATGYDITLIICIILFFVINLWMTIRICA